MGRSLSFYEISAATWRAHVGARDAATRAHLLSTSAGAHVDVQAVDAFLGGSLDGTTLESWHHAQVARALASVGQAPSLAPAGERFWYSLSQIALVGGTVDDTPLARSAVARRVMRYLRAGRPLLGEAFAGEGPQALSDVYGWLESGDETDALAEIVSSPAWSRLPLQARYRKGWTAEQQAASAWAAGLTAAGKDVLFTSSPL